MVALAHLKRSSEDSSLPELPHLGESGKIEQDADVVMFIHCDESELEKRNKSEQYRLQVIVRKHRNGRIGLNLKVTQPESPRRWLGPLACRRVSSRLVVFSRTRLYASNDITH